MIYGQRIVASSEFKAEADGWYVQRIPATGWHGIHLPPARELLVYVSDIDWTNPHKRYTHLGGPGEEAGILFGPHNGITIWITSSDANNPNRYFSTSGNPLPTFFTTTVNDHYGEDNTGSYTIHVKVVR